MAAHNQIIQAKSATYQVGKLAALEQLLASIPLLPGPLVRMREDVDRLADRMGEAQLHCAIVGQFKRGKSSLLNGIIGADVLPTAVTPLTAISTYIRKGRSFFLRSEGDEGIEEITLASAAALAQALADRVTERGNPNNKKLLRRVEATLIAPALPDGLTFIDTPGIGSTLHHNTAAAISTLPDCDVAIFVISPDPPFTAAELEYLKSVLSHTTETIIVINKIDIVDQQGRLEVEAFVRDALASAGLPDIQIFNVSTRIRVEEVQHRNSQADASGFAALTEYIRSVAAERRDAIASDVADLKTATLSREINEYLNQCLGALRMPIDVLRATLETFETSSAALSREANVLEDQSLASKNSLLRRLDEEVGAFRDRYEAELAEELNRKLSAGESEASIASFLAAEIPARFEAQFSLFEHNFVLMTKESLTGLIESAERFIRRAKEVGRDLLRLTEEPVPTTLSVSPNVRPYWVDVQRPTLSGGVTGFYDQLLPSSIRLERARGRLNDITKDLLTRNAEHMRWSIRRAIEEAFRSFVIAWKQTLERAQGATRAAITSGLTRLEEASVDAALEITTLQNLRDEIQSRILSGAPE